MSCDLLDMMKGALQCTSSSYLEVVFGQRLLVCIGTVIAVGLDHLWADVEDAVLHLLDFETVLLQLESSSSRSSVSVDDLLLEE